MPRLATGLTVKQINVAKPKTTLSDGRGLSLMVDANGNKRWVFRYTRPDGRRNWLGLGSYPDTSLLMARSVAQEARERLSNGEDPADIKKDSKRAEKAAVRGTFKAIAEEWYAHKAKSWASETARKARESLDDDLFPKLGTKPIAEITSADIKPVILLVHERAPRLAVKARQYCNQIIEYAIQEGLREDGRLLSLRGALPKAPKGHYAAVTKANDLPALIGAINAISSPQSRAAILCCLYTALRPGVVVGARWDEFDLNAMEWHIPAPRMKMGNDHITPIPSQMLPLLERQREFTDDSPFVFPGARNPKIQHMHRDSLSKVLRENGLRGVTVTHGFRATLRTIAREKFRVDADILEAQLAHAKKDEIQAAYDRTQFLEERHELVQNWADYLDAQSKSVNVVQLRCQVA
ncbi:MAG: integrase arm-type DNA-binding domain-containing protein [Nitrosospira sp.]|jgi:integrase|nr:integrase arm-type DNA-binding domain-containing protein [Nitrosospira sp.]MBP0133192.1 integrase arm-type DNA-binding domain-containing protein [Nitrosospira sp.]